MKYAKLKSISLLQDFIIDISMYEMFLHLYRDEDKICYSFRYFLHNMTMFFKSYQLLNNVVSVYVSLGFN